MSEVATMNTLAKATPRAGDDLVELENFAAPELPSTGEDERPAAPPENDPNFHDRAKK